MWINQNNKISLYIVAFEGGLIGNSYINTDRHRVWFLKIVNKSQLKVNCTVRRFGCDYFSKKAIRWKIKVMPYFPAWFFSIHLNIYDELFI